MSEPDRTDEALKKMLEQWRPSGPSPALDDRVMASYRKSVRGVTPIRSRARIWFAAAAVAAGVLVGAWLLLREPVRQSPVRLDSVLAAAPEGPAYETSVDSSAFKPVKEVKIVVLPKGGSQ
jgi:hypothetical protein